MAGSAANPDPVESDPSATKANIPRCSSEAASGPFPKANLNGYDSPS
jgi:hypothetical protein